MEEQGKAVSAQTEAELWLTRRKLEAEDHGGKGDRRGSCHLAGVMELVKPM